MKKAKKMSAREKAHEKKESPAMKRKEAKRGRKS